MFGSVGEVVKGLKAYRDYYSPKSASVLIASNKTTDVDSDPFRHGFLDSLDLRTALLQRLAALTDRERAVVMMWYVHDLPVMTICAKLSLSRTHCYRLRDRALFAMLDTADVKELQPA